MTTELDQVLSGSRRWCVIHADCLEVLRSLPYQCGVVVTDVPYQVGKALDNDGLPWEQYLPWLDERLLECCAVGKRVFTTFATTRVLRFIRETTCPPDYLLHWHKPFLLHSRSLNGSPFMAHGEQILYWGPTSAKKGGKRGYDSFAFNSLWPRERKIEGIEAPTPKPVSLFMATMEFWLDPGDLVIDPFVGSGSILIAALRRGHRCIGVDTDIERIIESRRRLEAEDRQTSLGFEKRGQQALFQGGNHDT